MGHYVTKQAITPLEAIQKAVLISQPLTDSDILDLQDLFLTPGIHSIKVKNVQEGRNIVDVFITTLISDYNIACLSVEDRALPKTVCDLYEQLAEQGYLDSSNMHHLDEYFVHSFYFGFMWIEASEKLERMHWFKLFIAKIAEFNIDQSIPVIRVVYDTYEQ